MRAGALALAFAACLSPTTQAADDSGNYAIWGAGARSCNQFAGSVDDDDTRASFRDFLMGYLTAYNTIAEDTYNALGPLDLDQALAWLDGYCAEHRMDSFERAVTQLVVGQHPARARVPPGQGSGWGRSSGGGHTP